VFIYALLSFYKLLQMCKYYKNNKSPGGSRGVAVNATATNSIFNPVHKLHYIRRQRSQQRACSYRQGNLNHTNKHKKQANRYKSFRKGIEQFRQSLTPSLDTLLQTSRATTDDDVQAAARESVKVTAAQINSARLEEEDVVHSMLQVGYRGLLVTFPLSNLTT
jgi:hypothetical protein